MLCRKRCVLSNSSDAECPLIHMLDSRLTGGDGDVGKGGVKNMRLQTHPHPIIFAHTNTDDHSPSLQIMVLSAAPVQQTVRGSLAGVPQGSVIGLLEKPPSGPGTYR